MNKVFLLFCLLLAAPSGAEVVTIGTTDIPYETPRGFARADALFPLPLKELDKEFGMQTVIFAKYVPVAYLATQKMDQEALPDWYIHLTYDEKLSKIPLLRMGFVAITALVNKIIAHAYDSDAFIGKLEKIFCQALGRKVTITVMTQKGFVEGKSRSMLATGGAMIEGKTAPIELRIASMTTFVLTQYKLITVTQIGRINSDADLPIFTQQALDHVEQMFPSLD